MTRAFGPLDASILLVDDEPANLDLLEDLLRRRGYRAIARTDDAREALPLYRSARPDIVLLDLHMPHRTGFEVLADLRADTPADDYRPVLVLTADATVETKQRALGEGAHDFVTKPFVNAEVVLRVRNLLHTRALYVAQQAARQAAERAGRRTALLAEASRALASSLDGDTALAQLARVLVPAFADDCAAEDGDGAAPGSPAELRVPLRAGPATLGHLRLRRDASRPFDADEVALAEELGRRAALALEHARLFALARAATEERERILAVVAHDLRTPLAAMLMDAEMLRARQDGAAVTRDAAREAATVARLHRAAGRMDALIEDLLEVTRLDRGALAIEPRAHGVAALLAEAETVLRPLAEAAQLALRVEPVDPATTIVVDDARLLQLLSNLVGNAIKFTPSPGVVTLAAAVRDGECRLEVRDTGPGIPAEQLPHLFGAFWQARHADRRGLGLGLAIARGIAEAHGGRIWAESAAGQGTTFVVTLPVQGPVAGDARP